MKCEFCKKVRVGEPHTFICLSGGALYGTQQNAGPNDKMFGFLDVVLHGADTSEKGEGLYPNEYAMVAIDEDVE